MDLEFKVTLCSTGEIILETNNYKEAIEKLKELELKDYHDQLDYEQWCAENYERPADFYPTYYIEEKSTGRNYSIENYRELERKYENEA